MYMYNAISHLIYLFRKPIYSFANGRGHMLNLGGCAPKQPKEDSGHQKLPLHAPNNMSLPITATPLSLSLYKHSYAT
jgi:hypothetical protein